MITYREANANELPTIANLFALSFKAYPFFDLFMNKQLKERLFYEMHALNTKAYFHKHSCLVATRDNKIIAAVLLKHQDRKDIGFFDYLFSGGLTLAVKGSPSFIRDFLVVSQKSKESIKRLNEPVWYLESFVVAPSQQGQRVGSKLLHDCIIPYISKNGGGILTLITNTEMNRVFYLKNGFEEIDASTLKRNGHEVENWSFKKTIHSSNVKDL